MKRRAVIVTLTVLVVIGALLLLVTVQRPLKRALPVVLSALRQYASEHGGLFPLADGDPLRSLELLHPDYLPDPHRLEEPGVILWPDRSFWCN